MAEVIAENGGRIRLNSLVTEIVIEDNRATMVKTSDGACFDASYVISNASAPSTVLDLVGAEHLSSVGESDPYHPSRIEADNETSLADSFSALVIHLGVDHDYSTEFGDAHEFLVGETIDQNENFAWMRANDVEKSEFIVCNYTSLDPTMAPAGKTVLGIVTLLEMDWEDDWRWWQGHASYDDLKAETAARMIDRLEQDLLPGLSDHIEVMEIAAPHTMRGFTLNRDGAIYGWEHGTDQALMNRLPQQTPIDNLLLAGAWTFPGAGQSAVMSSGQTAAKIVLRMQAQE